MPYGAPVSRLDDLIDVFGWGTVEGDMLYFDALSGTFMVGARPNLAELLANTLILNDIGDVNIPAPATLDFIYWDDTAGKWVNISYALLLASIQGDTTLDDLAGVNVPAPADDDVLYWNDGASEWQSKAIPSITHTVVSDILQHSNDAVKSTVNVAYTKVKEILLTAAIPNCRVKFDLQNNTVGKTAYGKVYKNGVAIGVERSKGPIYQTFSEDFAGFAKDDLIQIYAKTDAGGQADVKNFRFYYSLSLGAQTNQDP